MKPIIKVENLSKQYRLGTVGTGTFAHDVNRWWHTIRGKEDPYQKLGELNDRANKGNSEYVWALKDIDFEVQPGEVLGIIGKNGAGKSTLLKLLSRVTGPTTGVIEARGRIASLLEVGTGFHPELTGRENVYLNGAILGMTKQEIHSKLDEIVDFSGCERYLDTPVKRYSSGMKVRLAFAVAAHLEPEILIVDEVLAVGDAEFQKKAIGKMKDVSKGEGRTVLFVSHNMASVQSLCSRAIVLHNGTNIFSDSTEKAIDFYINEFNRDLSANVSLKNHPNRISNSSPHPVLERLRILDSSGNERSTFKPLEDIVFEIQIDSSLYEFDIAALRVVIDDDREVRVFNLWSDLMLKEDISIKGRNQFYLTIKKNTLGPRGYKVRILTALASNPLRDVDRIDDVAFFEVIEADFYGTGKIRQFNNQPMYYPEAEWSLESTVLI